MQLSVSITHYLLVGRGRRSRRNVLKAIPESQKTAPARAKLHHDSEWEDGYGNIWAPRQLKQISWTPFSGSLGCFNGTWLFLGGAHHPGSAAESRTLGKMSEGVSWRPVVLGLWGNHKLSRNSSLIVSFVGQFMVAVFLFNLCLTHYDLLKNYITTLIKLPASVYYRPSKIFILHTLAHFSKYHSFLQYPLGRTAWRIWESIPEQGCRQL